MRASASTAFESGKVGTWGSTSVSPREPRGLAGVAGEPQGEQRSFCGQTPLLPWRLCAAAPLQTLCRCPARHRLPAPLCRSRALCGRCSCVSAAAAAAAFMFLVHLQPGPALSCKWAGMKLSSQPWGTQDPVTWTEGSRAPGCAIFAFLTHSNLWLRYWR